MATEVVMPAMGLTVEKGIIVKWFKKEGDAVTRGEDRSSTSIVSKLIPLASNASTTAWNS